MSIGPGPVPPTLTSSASPLRTVSADYTLAPTDGIVEVNASGGSCTITAPPSLGAAASARIYLVVKTDATSNPVQISNGTTVVDAITSPATADGQVSGWRSVYGNGTSIRSYGVG